MMLNDTLNRRCVISVGSSCSHAELNRAHDAVEACQRENGTRADHSGGGSVPSADVNLRGSGVFYGGDNLNGRITGHSEGEYVTFN